MELIIIESVDFSLEPETLQVSGLYSDWDQERPEHNLAQPATRSCGGQQRLHDAKVGPTTPHCLFGYQYEKIGSSFSGLKLFLMS